MKKILSLTIVCSLLLGMSQPAAILKSSADSPDEKISEDLMEYMSSSDDRAPVAVWYTDFEMDELESRIQSDIGYTSEDLEADYEMPSSELSDALNEAAQKLNEKYKDTTDFTCKEGTEIYEDGMDYLNQLFSSHLDATAEARKIEKERTDTYMDSRIRICTEMHYEMAESIIAECDISYENVDYTSRFSPLIVCTLSADEIERLNECEKIQNLTLYDDMVFEEYTEQSVQAPSSSLISSYNTNNASVGVTKARTRTGLTGSGVGIGVYGQGNIANSPTELQNLDSSLPGLLDTSHVVTVCNCSTSCYSVSHHDTWCATVAAGTNGVAPNATLYSSNCNGDAYFTSHLAKYEELIATNNVKVMFWENVGVNSSTPAYTNMERLVDYSIKDSGVMNVIPAGNRASYICDPGNAYNAITVGGFVAGSNSNTFYSDSNYIAGSHCKKPDVIAPAKLGNTSGTSYAAPMVAGMIAMLLEYKPSLAAKPELVKAILMASCHSKVNETMTGRLTNKEGAGIPNMYTMLCIASQQTYGYGCLTSSNNYQQDRFFKMQKYSAGKVNLCMAYLHSGTGNSSGDSLNFDIVLKKRTGTTIQASSYLNSSVEMLYTTAVTSDCKLEVSESGPYYETSRYGYAWSTSNTETLGLENKKADDMVCFLRNSGSGLYLTQNTTNNTLYQTAYTGANNQMWVLHEDPLTQDYNMYNGATKDKGIVRGNQISFGYYSAKISTSASYMIDRMNLWDGSEKILFGNYALRTLNSSTSSGATMAWELFTNTDSTQNWFLEVVPYRKGDVNCNDLIDSTDVTRIQTMATNIAVGQTYPNRDMYLADFDNNGYVETADAVALSAYISGGN